MGEKLSKVSLPNSAGTIITYEFKDRYAADTRITEEDLASIFNKNLSTEDELAGTWVWNSNIDIDSITDGTEEFTVNFSSNGVNYTQLNIHNIILTRFRESWIYYGSDTVWGYDDGWYNTAYRTITITSKLSEVSYGSSLLSILQANATKQGATSLITFTIAGTTYQAEEGMTWGEWVESDYNTDGFVFHAGSLCTSLLNYHVTNAGGSSATITEGTNYSMSPYGGGN